MATDIKVNICSGDGLIGLHYDDVIMGAIATLITSLTIVYSTVYSDADQRKHQSSASLAFVWGIHRGRGKCFHLMTSSCHKWASVALTWNMWTVCWLLRNGKWGTFLTKCQISTNERPIVFKTISSKLPILFNSITMKSCVSHVFKKQTDHNIDVIMTTIVSQITSLTIVYSTVYPGADQSKHQSSASLAFVWGIHRRPVNSPHKWPVTRKMFPFDDVIMYWYGLDFLYKSFVIHRAKIYEPRSP